MRRKFFVILVCCLLALAVLVLSQNGERVTKANQIKSLLITPKTAPKPAPRLILKFSTREELQQLLLQQEEGQEQVYPETYIRTEGVAGANADPMTGRVWAVALGDGLDPHDFICAGFKTIPLENTGSFSQTGVTVTANILEIQSPESAIVFYLQAGIFKDDGEGYTAVMSQGMLGLGSQSVTSRHFTMEPGHTYQAVGLICCESNMLNQVISVVAEITDIDWNF